MLAIARRVAADHLRSARTRPRADPALAVDDGRLAAAGVVAESVSLRDLLERLEPERRMAFALTQVVGLSYAEAALVCRCPVGTIRSRVARARDDVAAQLADRGPVTGAAHARTPAERRRLSG